MFLFDRSPCTDGSRQKPSLIKTANRRRTVAVGAKKPLIPPPVKSRESNRGNKGDGRRRAGVTMGAVRELPRRAGHGNDH